MLLCGTLNDENGLRWLIANKRTFVFVIPPQLVRPYRNTHPTVPCSSSDALFYFLTG
jgi:hypothetical protein